MKTCYIFGAGELPDRLSPQIGKEDFVIAADAGYEYLKRRNICANLVVGDFDSLGRCPEHPNVVEHSSIKDDTDTALAVEEGKKRGYTRFAIYGSLGGRLGHTVANLQTAARLAAEKCEVFLVGSDTVVTALHNGSVSLDTSKRGYISVFSALDRAEGVFLKGLKYPLSDAVLTSTVPLGVSNEFLGVEAEISVACGTLIVMWQESDFNPALSGCCFKSER